MSAKRSSLRCDCLALLFPCESILRSSGSLLCIEASLSFFCVFSFSRPLSDGIFFFSSALAELPLFKPCAIEDIAERLTAPCIGKDLGERLHCCLIPWEDLDDLSARENAVTGKSVDYKQMDRNNVLTLPELLKG